MHLAATLRAAGCAVDMVLQPKKTKWLFKHADRLDAKFVVLLAPQARALHRPVACCVISHSMYAGRGSVGGGAGVSARQKPSRRDANGRAARGDRKRDHCLSKPYVHTMPIRRTADLVTFHAHIFQRWGPPMISPRLLSATISCAISSSPAFLCSLCLVCDTCASATNWVPNRHHIFSAFRSIPSYLNNCLAI